MRKAIALLGKDINGSFCILSKIKGQKEKGDVSFQIFYITVRKRGNRFYECCTTVLKPEVYDKMTSIARQPQ